MRYTQIKKSVKITERTVFITENLIILKISKILVNLINDPDFKNGPYLGK